MHDPPRGIEDLAQVVVRALWGVLLAHQREVRGREKAHPSSLASVGYGFRFGMHACYRPRRFMTRSDGNGELWDREHGGIQAGGGRLLRRDRAEQSYRVDARPSDAIALATRRRSRWRPRSSKKVVTSPSGPGWIPGGKTSAWDRCNSRAARRLKTYRRRPLRWYYLCVIKNLGES